MTGGHGHASHGDPRPHAGAGTTQRPRPPRSAGGPEGAMRLRRGPRGLGTRLKGVFTRRIRHLSC